jgi:hypothetical protein
MSTDFDGEPLKGEGARLFGVARGASGEVSSGRKQALHAAILASAAVGAATTATSAAGAAAAVGHTAEAAAGAGASQAAVATSVTSTLAMKTVLGGLVGVLVGSVLIGAAVLAEGPGPRSAPGLAASVTPANVAPTAPPSALGAPTSVPSATEAAPSAEVPARPSPARVVESAPKVEPDVVNDVDDVSPSPSPSVASSAGSLSEEAAALQDVSRALADGKTDEALRLLEAQPAGVLLDEERAAAKIVALCQGGRAVEAEPLRASFRAAHPRSTQRARIESACRPR